jgi:F-type H+-transporting ATPase subunit delta
VLGISNSDWAESSVADEFRETEVGERYAIALFQLALDSGALGKVSEDLTTLTALLRESRELARMLASPIFGSDAKRRVLEAVGEKAGLSPLTLKFLGLLAVNHRAGALASVILSFRRMHDRHRGVVSAQVTSAIKLTSGQLVGVQKALSQALGKEPELSTVVDPAILGGIKVKVGSRLYDASLKTKLDTLKFALKRA